MSVAGVCDFWCSDLNFELISPVVPVCTQLKGQLKIVTPKVALGNAGSRVLTRPRSPKGRESRASSKYFTSKNNNYMILMTHIMTDVAHTVSAT